MANTSEKNGTRSDEGLLATRIWNIPLVKGEDFLVEDVLQPALNRIMKMVHAESALVLLTPETDPTQGQRYPLGLDRDRVESYIQEVKGGGESLAKLAVEGDEVVAVAGPALNQYKERQLLRRPGLACAAALPLRSQKARVGILVLLRYGRRRFSLHEMELCKAVAGQLAVALENVKLFEILYRGKTDWEKTFDAMQDLVAILDREGRFVRVNRALATFLNSQPRFLIGKSYFDLFYGSSRIPDYCPVKKALRTRTSQSEEFDNPRFKVSVLVSVSPMLTQDGAFLGAVVTARDVSERKRLQRQLTQAEKLSALGELVAGVAHELNNPLTSILGYAELLMDTPVDVSSKQDLRKIHEQGKRMLRIVQNLLRFARNYTPEKGLVDLNAVLRTTLELKEYELQSASIEIGQDLAADLPAVVGDANQLEQVFLNVINNAHQAMQSHGSGVLSISSRHESGLIRVRISDTGHGISQEDTTRIFDPFFTTKPVGKGTGLGLSVSFGIVRQHGGSIFVESTSEKGTTFVVDLPASS